MSKALTSENEFDDIVRAIYGCVLDPDLWLPTIGRIGGQLRADAATVELHRRRPGPPLFFQGVGIDKDNMDAYVNYYAEVCPRVGWNHRSQAGDVTHDYMYATESELNKLEFYEDFLRRHNLRYFMSGTLVADPNRLGLVSLQRSPQVGSPDADELSWLGRYVPHFRTAMQLATASGSTSMQGDSLENVLQKLRAGALLFDRDGRTTFLNDQAQRLLQEHGGLGHRKRRLTCRSRPLAKQLEALVRGVSSQIATGGALTVPSPGIDWKILLQVVPLHAQVSSPLQILGASTMSEPVGLVMMVDPLQDAWTMLELIQTFSLTPSEAQLAQSLIRGESLEGHSKRKGVSINTTRTHLARLRQKTGCTSQAEIVSKLLRLASPLSSNLSANK